MYCKLRCFGSSCLSLKTSQQMKPKIPTLHYMCKCSISISVDLHGTLLHQPPPMGHCLSTICPVTVSNTEHRWDAQRGELLSHTHTPIPLWHMSLSPSVHLSTYVFISLLVSLYPLVGEVNYHLSTALKFCVCMCTFMWMLDPSYHPCVYVSGETLVKSSWA